MKNVITLFSFVVPLSLFAQVTITNTTDYDLLGQMLLANEINESGEPFAEDLGYDLDELDPMVPMMPDSISYTTGIENYEYSRYQLGTVIARAGIGLHMMWSPLIMSHAAEETDPDFDGSFTGGVANGFKEDDELRKTVMGFSMRTGYTPPMNPWPQFAEFMSGDPHLPQAVDADFGENFKTLRWDRSKMDKTFNPGAMGQTMMKQYLWAQDMLGGFHDGNEEEVDPADATPDVEGSFEFDPDNNVFYGGDNADGFIGMLATAEAINKMAFFRSKLAYNGTDLGGVDPATYDPANGILYFPHKIAVTEMQVAPMLPPKMETLTVTDPSSHLFDQLSVLWATLNFKNMMDPDNSDESHAGYHSVFDGDPFPGPASQTGMPGPFDLMKGMSKVLFLNIMTMHFNSTMGSFVNVSNLSGGVPQMENEISAVEAGYILAILSKFVEEFAGTPLEGMAMNAVNAQANFILDKFKDGSDGYYNSVTLGTGPDTGTKLAVSQAAIARGLYAAYSITSNNDFLNGADDAYNALILNYYIPTDKAFMTERGNATATYTPFNIAVISGALREAALVGEHSEAPMVFTRFFTNVGDKMQLSEAGATGESGGDSDNDGIPFIPEQPDGLPPVFAPEATLDLTITGVDNVQFARELNLRNYPNPFEVQTTIYFDLPEAAPVSVEVFDLNGRLVNTLFDGALTAGAQSIEWNSEGYAPGVYYYQLRSGERFSTNKVVLIK
ncbi:MAG TPA: T9SS type A sorting domain-containing protein [Bacteroidetes bacterium]|nr:T9SS type A sorting domain-containing protein [Bacteroidota bacterium]